MCHCKAQVPFPDVAACFSDEEWKLLQEWQKELYRNVMKEIHQALISLGPLIATTVCSLRTKEKAEMCPVDNQFYESKHRINHPPSAMMAELPVPSEEPVHLKHLQDLAGRDMHDSLSEGFPFLNTDNLSRKEEPISDFMDYLGPEMGRSTANLNAGHEIVSFCIKDEDEVYFVDHQDRPPGDGSISRKRKIGNAPKAAEKTAELKSFPGRMSAVGFQTSSNGAKPGESRSQMLPECYEVLGGENTSQSQTSFGDPVHFNVHQKSPHIGAVDNSKAFKHKQHGSQLSHNLQKERTHMCPEDDNRQSLMGEFTRHMRNTSRDRPYPCTECKKSFFQKTHLIVHGRIHSGEKPYVCSFCHKRFNRKDYLNEHTRIHTGERPYKCGKCEKSFIQKSHLVYHQRKHSQNFKSANLRSGCRIVPNRTEQTTNRVDK
ncbi:zinc finger protein 282-like isoform X2 [Ambystoma mexicanum]|uniref:zinc finger protein 282-like isoform X2 n=1 Tax=Ambystoma mexicanum TaxID=8296 RepID=UPI0037E87459